MFKLWLYKCLWQDFKQTLNKLETSSPDRDEHKRKKTLRQWRFLTTQKKRYVFIFWKPEKHFGSGHQPGMHGQPQRLLQDLGLEHITSILGKPCNKGLHFLSIYIYRYKHIYICILIQGTNISHLIWEMHRFDPTPLCSDITQCWKLITYLLTTCCKSGQWLTCLAVSNVP